MHIAIIGIDTDCGKTHATAMLAWALHRAGVSFATQKWVQTGADTPIDWQAHAKFLPHMPPFSIEHCPYLFNTPASPHLAAHLQNTRIDGDKIHQSAQKLIKTHRHLISETAGGVLVPINKHDDNLSLIQKWRLPVILVVHARLGSINHTRLTLLALKNHVNLVGVLFNDYICTDRVITDDTRALFLDYLHHFKGTQMLDLPSLPSDDFYQGAMAMLSAHLSS